MHLPPPSDDDVTAILARVLRQAKKDFADLDAAWPEDEYEEGQRESLQRPLGLELPPTARRRRVAVAHGFSLHADTWVHGNDRQGLERPCRYGARGPVAESRLRRLDDGRYEYLPKKGVTFVVTAEHLVRRLVSLVPPAKTHLTSFHGVYAPHSALRPVVTQPPKPPQPVAGWLWIGSSPSISALTRKTAQVVRQLSEEQEIAQERDTSAFTILVYIFAGLFAIELVILAMSLVVSLIQG